MTLPIVVGLLPVGLIVVGLVALAVGTWSVRLLNDPDRYVAAVAPLCGHRRTSALATVVLRRRLEQFVGRPAANRLHPLLSRVVTSGARSPIAITAWRAGNRVLHRHRRVVRLGRLPRVATGPVMVMTAIAGKVAGITSRGTGARGPITSPR